MSQRTIDEGPECTTAGLSSCTQVVDFTSAQTFSIGNTSSLLSVVGRVVPGGWPGNQQVEEASRKTDFRTALRESLRANESVVRKLAKY